MNEEIKIITLGDIFDNIETEEKAFKFKDYIKDLQQKVEQLEKENEYLKMSNPEQNMEHFRIVNENKRKIDMLRKENHQLEKENDKLKHKLNDIAFGDDSELALRFLRKIDYVDFDEKRKVYINKHNNEPFIWEDEREKDYYLKDEELNEYTQQLEYKVEQLENIRKEAIEELSYMSTDAYVEDYDIREKHYNLLMNILNKGDNK